MNVFSKLVNDSVENTVDERALNMPDTNGMYH